MPSAVRAGALHAAEAPCVQQHTVTYGENLLTIAQRYDTTVAHLVALNPGIIRNPNWIRAGVTLCLQREERSAYAVFEVHYQYTATAEESSIPILTAQGGLLGQRKLFPLLPNGIKIFKSQAEMTSALQSAKSAPLFWGSNNGPDEPDNYTLFLLQPVQDWFAALQLKERCTIPIQEAVAPLSSSTLNSVVATFVIETANGIRYPFPVTHLSHAAAFGQVDPCASRLIDFALLPANTAPPLRYQLFVLHPDARFADAEEDTEEVNQTNNRVALEINYQSRGRAPRDELALLTPGALIGKRLEYPLAPYGGFQPVNARTLPSDALEHEPSPLFYGFRQGDQNEYTLVALGDMALFTPLLITASQTISLPVACQWSSLEKALGSPQFAVKELTLFLEDGQGTRYPFHITQLGLAPNGQKANECRSPATVVAFALYGTEANKYHLKMLFNEENSELGPPGARRSANCRRWRLARGFLYGFLRNWWACW